MIIFGRRVDGVEPRFFVFIGVLLALLIGLFFFRGNSGPKSAAEAYAPAFPVQQLGDMPRNWIAPYERSYGGLQSIESAASLVGNYNGLVGEPVRFRAYIPPDVATGDYRPDLARSSRTLRWTFVPVALVDPTQAETSEKLDSLASDQQDQPVVVGFPTGSPVVAGRAYEFTGLFWWHTKSSFFQSSTQSTDQSGSSDVSTSPIILASQIEALSTAELRAPTTHRADVGLTYQEGNLQLYLRRVEWSAGAEMRVCLSVENTAKTPQANWSALSSSSGGLGGVLAQTGADQAPVVGSFDTDQGDQNPLATNQLLSEQRATGYLVFPGTVADPTQNLVLRMPSLGAQSSSYGQQDEIRVQVPRSEIRTVSAEDSVAGCSDRASALAAGSSSAATATSALGSSEQNAPTGSQGQAGSANTGSSVAPLSGSGPAGAAYNGQ